MNSGQQSEIDKRIMTVMVECMSVQTVDEFTRVVKGSLREVLPHEMMLCGIGGISKQGNNLRKIINCDYPMAYFEPMRDADGRIDSPLMKRWRETQEPQWFQAGRDDHELPEEWVSSFNKHDLRNTIAHGVLDVGGVFSSFFIFSRIPGNIGPEHAFLMKLLTPHLHFALARVLSMVEEYQGNLGKAKKALSERQREILHWLHEGKTNWEIARILDLSELNVKYHIDQIFQKLEVRSRAQAVAKGRDLAAVRS
ncbi:MAG: XrtB/PEP-CTERM-associated transcriptional regulator EpsA [Pseudomonadota bacterium]